ncbi:MAG TPA: SDR family oxidoreductase [Anaerolineales bacterium]|nr:SDR family oxidoreductase [Anaerolineales bacterium]
MHMNRRSAIDGKVVIVTGASSGIGESTAREFAQAGAIPVLAARRGERLERLQKEIEEMGGQALAVPTDLTDLDQITNLIQTTLSRFERIDVLANIAGWAIYDWFEELSSDELRQTYEVNVIGLAELTRQVIPTMKAQRSGFILNMSSYVSRISVPPLTVYASTKYAIEGLTDGLRRALLPWGITVIRIHPSSVSGTEFNQRVYRDGTVHYRPVPIGRISRERLARHIVDLVENPRRALFISRVYEVPVLLNKLFPEAVDWVSATWVRQKQREELPPQEEITPVQYPGSVSAWHLAAGFFLLVLIAKAWRKKS